ncbi:MAG: alpha/beta hydrolase, partial [Mycobacterium sp.]
RFVYGDYRVVELLSRRNAQESTAQLAAEIVLRTSTW